MSRITPAAADALMIIIMKSVSSGVGDGVEVVELLPVVVATKVTSSAQKANLSFL